MPEWLAAAVAPEELAWQTMGARLALAAVAGVVVAGIFLLSQRRWVGTFTLLTTLMLLTILVAMTTLVIGSNIARAFGLVGALSIVRFRTVVEDTRDTAFVIFAVVVGMAIGAGHLWICLLGMPLVAVVAMAMGQLGALIGEHSPEQRLEVRFGLNQDPDAKLEGLFQTHLHAWRLLSVGSAKQGTALDVAYAVRLRPATGPVTLVQSVQGLEGVLSAELTPL